MMAADEWLGAAPVAQVRIVDNLFLDFTTDWVRHDPNLATSTRYFTSPQRSTRTRGDSAHRRRKRDRIRRARQVLAELRKFNGASFTEPQRISADLMEWQLNEIISRGAVPRLHVSARSDERRQRGPGRDHSLPVWQGCSLQREQIGSFLAVVAGPHSKP
jgi:uncharacterized protein (DUF885 family)